MSYSLTSFSPEFFFNEAEPYDGGPEPSERPTSVWHAIVSMRILHPDRWEELARDVFNLSSPAYLTDEMVLDQIRQTDSCDSISRGSSGIYVNIDREGYYTVTVYSRRSGS